MDNSVQQYQLVQKGKKYILITKILQNKLRFSCTESDTINPLTFIGDFSMIDLMHLNPIFYPITNISQAQEIFDKIATTQKLSIEPGQNHINLKIFLKRENRPEECFSLLLNLSTSNGLYDEFSNFQLPISDNKKYTQEEMQNQFLSFFPNNNYDNTNINNIYSTSYTIPEQYIQYPQSQTTNSFYLNNQGNLPNINYNLSGNNFENSILHKSKRTRVDKLTLSLRPQQEKNNNNILRNQTWTNTSAPLKMQETFIPQKTPLFQQQNYESVNKNNIENSYDLNRHEIQKNTNNDFINKEKEKIIENLKNKINELNIEISNLRSQNEILKQENENMRLKNDINKNIENENQSQEILFLKQENERYLKEIDNLRDQLSQLNEFDQYKRNKEEEISLLKDQIEELLSNQKKNDQFLKDKIKEIDELKLYIEELLQKQRKSESEYQYMLRKSKKNEMEDQMISIQDTRLEIVRGDIIQDTKELELLTRKISKNNNKIILNLLFKAIVDSDKAEAFHEKCDFAKSTLVLVKSTNGKRFGGYTSCTWKGNNIEKKDDNAFVFSLDKMRIYDIKSGEDAIGCYPKFGPVFLGCQIRIYDQFFTKGGTTFEKGMNYNTEEDYELTGGLKKFNIKDIEVYSVEFE